MRAAPQAARIATLDDPALKVNNAGRGPISAEWMIPKSLWMAEHQPDLFERADYICDCQDYINFHLTGRMVANITSASTRWHYDSRTGYATSLLDKLNLTALLDRWPLEVLPLGDRDRRPHARRRRPSRPPRRPPRGARRLRRLHRHDRHGRRSAEPPRHDHRLIPQPLRLHRHRSPRSRLLGNLPRRRDPRPPRDRRRPDLHRLDHQLVQEADRPRHHLRRPQHRKPQPFLPAPKALSSWTTSRATEPPTPTPTPAEPSPA